MAKCPKCQREINDAARLIGRCLACGTALRALPQRTIADVRDFDLSEPGSATVSEILPEAGLVRPGEQTVEEPLAADVEEAAPLDPTVETTVEFSAEPAASAEPDEADTVVFDENATRAGGDVTINLAGEETLDFAKTDPDDADFTLLTHNWHGSVEGESQADPNQTIKQQETLSGSFISSSSLVVKSRNVRTPDIEATPIASADDAPDYEILKQIGKGGMGVVYAARQSSIARTVALKMLKGDLGRDSRSVMQREKFISEAVVTGELDHPNIVPIHDLGANENGALFYSMKLVKGTPWNDVIRKKSLDENLDILLRVADAVAFAHANGVVHRDLKPENTMLGDFGEVLVMDWGLARVTPEFRSAASITQTDAMGGTPAYMAPEMATGPVDRIAPSSDVYLLGAILFEIVARRPPHAGDSVMACLYNASKNKIVAVDEERARQYRELLDVALKAMATEPADRYQEVREFQAAIRDYQTHSESIRLAAHCETNLIKAAKEQDYDLYARALYALEEALTLWPENRRAKEQLATARIDYARLALAKGDFDLGISLLDRQNGEHAEILQKLQQGLRERESRQRRIKLLQRSVAGLAAAVLVAVSVGFFAVKSQRDVAVAERIRADENAQEALKQKGIAEGNLELAKTNETRALAGEALAKSNEQLAKDNERQAKDNEKLAKDNEQLAKDNAARAIAEADRATRAEKAALTAKNAEERTGYVTKIGLAKTKIDENAFEGAGLLLDACPESLRQWEWGRLQWLRQLSDRVWPAATPLDSLALAPDGSQFVAGEHGGDAVVRNRATGQEMQRFALGAAVRAAAYDPTGERLALGAASGMIEIHRVSDGQLLLQLDGHQQGVLDVSFSPDGEQLLSSGYDNTARLWNAATGAPQGVLQDHTWWVWAARFAPDGQSIVTASQDGRAIVWRRDAAEQYRQFTAFSGHKGPIYAACFAPNGQSIATAGQDGRICLWRPQDVRPVDVERRIQGQPDQPGKFIELGRHDAPVRALAFDPGGDRLASGGEDNLVILWDVAQREEPQRLRGHGGHVHDVAFAADGAWLLSAAADKSVRLWRPANYAEAWGITDAVLSARFAPDGRRIITASRDRTAAVWDAATLAKLQQLQEGHAYLATAAVFLGGDRLATAASDGTVRIWNAATAGQTQVIEGTGRLAALDADDSGQWLATGSKGRDALIWDAATGRRAAVLADHDSLVTAVRFAPGGQLLASGSERGSIRLWRRQADGGWRPAGALDGHSQQITALRFVQGGRRLISASGDNTCAQWDVATGKELPQLGLRHPEWVADLAVSADGERALTACDDGLLRVWSLADARLVRTLPVPEQHPPFSSVDLSADGKWAVAACVENGAVRLWNVETGEERHPAEALDEPWLRLTERGGAAWAARFAPDDQTVIVLGGNDARAFRLADGEPQHRYASHTAVADADLSPDGRRAVTASWDGTAKIWDAAAGKAIAKIEAGHRGAINSVRFAPDGSRILTAGDDGTARFWSAQDGTALEPVLRGHQGPIKQAAFSPDGHAVLTVSTDETARLFDAQSGAVLQELVDHEGQSLLCGAFSADGAQVIVGGEDDRAAIWRVADGALLMKFVGGHTADVTAAAISADGERVLTGSVDGSIRVWDAQPNADVADGAGEAAPNGPDEAREILALTGHRDDVTGVSFSPDGLRVLSSSRDGRVLIWPAVDWQDGGRQARK